MTAMEGFNSESLTPRPAIVRFKSKDHHEQPQATLPSFYRVSTLHGAPEQKVSPSWLFKSRVSTKASPTLPCFLQHQLFLIYLLFIQARDNLYVVAYSCNPALRRLGEKNYKFKVRLDYKINLLVCFLAFLWSESSLVDLINFTPFLRQT